MRMVLYSLAIAAIAALASPAQAGDAEDSKLAQLIARNLKESGRLSGYKVSVAVRDGQVWLSGHVRSEEQAAAALDVAQQSQGVLEVVDRLSIASTTSQPRRSVMARPAATTQSAVKDETAANVEPQPEPAQAEKSLSQRLKRSLARSPSQSTSSRGVELTHSQQPVPQAVNQNAQLKRRPAPAQGMRIAQRGATPAAMARMQRMQGMQGMPQGQPIAAYAPGAGRVAPVQFDHAHMPNHAWPSYAAHPNYAGLTYPKQYSPTAWPYIGPFYPYPQVPLGWRKVSLEWDDGWWMLDFKD